MPNMQLNKLWYNSVTTNKFPVSLTQCIKAKREVPNHKLIKKIIQIVDKYLRNLQSKYYDPDSNKNLKFPPVKILNDRNLRKLQKSASKMPHGKYKLQRLVPLFF